MDAELKNEPIYVGYNASMTVDEAADALRRRGYVVIPKSRRLILTINTRFDKSILQQSREEAERYMQSQQWHHASALGRKMMEDGAVLVEREEHNSGSPFFADEIVMRSTCALIMPKKDGVDG